MLFPKTTGRALALFAWLIATHFILPGQSPCELCTAVLSDTLPADTIFLEAASPGRVGESYSEAVSFRVPQTTTPVAASDPSVPPDIAISSFTVKNVTNLPPGLSWQVSQTRFELPGETDGCIRFCGTPLQAGLYEVEVVVTARVLIVDQTASFTFPILVEPARSITEGFTVVNDIGCGRVEAGFVNNLPSEGREGFHYRWDFGNGNMSLEENPGSQTYDAPGIYEVEYQAVIDTTGHFLTNVRVESVGCGDPFNNAPDLQLKIYDPDGTEVYSSGVLRDTRPPVDFTLNLEVGEGNYVIAILDDDDGVFGGDKTCGTFDFNRLSEGSLTDSDARISIRLLHPVDTVTSRDTITVFPQPAPPALTLESEGPLCAGDTVVLAASYSDGIEWYRDSLLVLEAAENRLPVGASGQYRARYTSPDGCQSASEPYVLDFSPPPPVPVLAVDRNLLYLADSLQLSDTYRIEWLLADTLLSDEEAAAFCAFTSGVYELRLTDEGSGCSSSASLEVIYDPAFPDCTSSMEQFDRVVTAVKLFPNPTDGPLHLRIQVAAPTPLAIQLFNAQGQLLRAERTERISGRREWDMDLSELPAGLYVLRVQAKGGERGFRLVVR